MRNNKGGKMAISEVKNMDCIEYMQQFPDKYFELAIVDPPYGIDIAKWDSIDLKPSQEYFIELFRVSKKQIIWGGNYFNLPHSEGWICWDKTFKYNQKLAVGHFELAWSNLDIKHSFIRFTSCGNFQGFENPKANYEKKKSFHPTSKPIEIYKFCLQKYAKPNDKILDTHLGSGSSRIAADMEGFDFYACELDKDYFDMSCKRFEEYKQQLKLL
jgi:site-specific DNA-methyltransferase (adenine-specific)